MENTTNYIQILQDFLKKNKGFSFMRDIKIGVIKLYQRKDKKSIVFNERDIEKIIARKDTNGDIFLQINFINRKRILLTKKLIGFAPAACSGLDMNKLPKVVTTPDLLNVVEALESALCGEDSYEENFTELKLFFESISCGAEAIGFNVAAERLWVEKLISSYFITASSRVF